MSMTPLEELRHSASLIRATTADALRRELADADWSMLERRGDRSRKALKS